MRIYYVELTGGRCGLSDQSKTSIMREEGTANVKQISVATDEQIDHVRSMGGYVPQQKPAAKRSATTTNAA